MARGEDLTPEQLEVLVPLTFGGRHLTTKGGSFSAEPPAGLTFLCWKAYLIAQLFGKNITVGVWDSQHGSVSLPYCLLARARPQTKGLAWCQELFYGRREAFITPEIIKHLSLRGLAMLYFDDGSNSPPTIHGLRSKAQAQRLADKAEELLGCAPFLVAGHSARWAVHATAANQQALLGAAQRYCAPDMSYMLEPHRAPGPCLRPLTGLPPGVQVKHSLPEQWVDN